MLVQQIEDQVATGRIIFGCNHPVYCWALLCACGSTIISQSPKDRHHLNMESTDLTSGKLAMCGEEILGYLRTGLKAGPRWQHDIWLGKTMSGNQNIVGTVARVFITRSIRRTPTLFNFGSTWMIRKLALGIWTCSLGQQIGSQQMCDSAACVWRRLRNASSIDLEDIQVHKYAVEYSEEDVEQSAERDVPEPPPDLSVAASSKAAAMDVSADPTHFFSVQRLHGFRQVVTHVQPQQKDEFVNDHAIESLKRALVMDLYIVQ